MALALAHTCLTVTAPNPRVGCVLTSPVGDVIGAGHTHVETNGAETGAVIP